MTRVVVGSEHTKNMTHIFMSNAKKDLSMML
jgi:hypothetical protein